MAQDALNKILSCVGGDGRTVCDVLVEDDEVKNAPPPPPGAAPLLKKIHLTVISKNEILLTPDNSRKKTGLMSTLLSTTSGTDQNRCCDGILIRIKSKPQPKKFDLEVGYFDMKSGNPSGYSGQFYSAQCFVKGYLIEIVRSFHGIECAVVKERFTIFHTDKHDAAFSIRKKPTRAKVDEDCSPTNPKKVVVQNNDRVHASILL